MAAVGLAIPFLRVYNKSSGPSASDEFWIIETDATSGALGVAESVEEGDPSVRAWCYASGYRSEGKPFPVGFGLYQTRALFIKIASPVDGVWAESWDIPGYAAIAQTARDWAETVPKLRPYIGPLNGPDPARTRTWALDPVGIFSSALLDVPVVILLVRRINALICGRRQRLRQERADAGRCVVCGYEVGNQCPAVCPECGGLTPGVHDARAHA